MRHPLNWLLRPGRSPQEYRALLGDLDETYQRHIRPHRSWLGSHLWYLRELTAACWFASADSVRPQDASRIHPGDRPSGPLQRALGNLDSDLRQAVRALRHQPWSTAAIVMTLAMGIGASAAVYAVFNYSLFRPVPGVVDEARLVTVRVRADEAPRSETTGTFDHLVAMRGVPALNGLAAHVKQTYPVRARPADDPTMVSVTVVSLGFFDVLGVRPVAGRLFSEGEYESADSRLAVISERLWRTRFGAAADIAGTDLLIVDHVFTVIGVARGFRGLSRVGGDDIWVPLGAKRTLMGDSTLYPQRMAGRLAEGVTLNTVRQQTRAAFARVGVVTQGDETFNAVVFPGLSDGFNLVETRMGALFRMASAGSGLLLLLACANAGGLLVSRMLARRRDISVKVALGASRYRLFRESLFEVAAIAAVAAIAGLVAARGLVSVFRSLRLTSWMPPLSDLSLDWRVGVFAAGAAVLTVLLAGGVPSVLASRTDPQSGLQSSGRGVSRSPRIRQVLTMAQVALSLALVAGAIALGQTVSKLHSVDLGFNPSHLYTLDLRPRDVGRDPARPFFDEVQRRLAETPGISAAAFALFHHIGTGSLVDVQVAPDASPQRVYQRAVSADYLVALGIPLLEGRMLTDAETRGPSRENPVVLDAVMARLLFGSDPAVGQSIYTTWPEPHRRDVVGVVGGTSTQGLRDGHLPAMYVGAGDLRIATMHVRSTLPPAEAVQTIRRVVREVEPRLAAEDIETTEMVINELSAEERVLARLSLVLALIALGLAISGIYAAIASGVHERTREFGIRMALGASRPAVGRAVIGRTMTVTGVGLAGGLALYGWASRYLEARLFGVTPLDPLVLTAACALLLVAALSAAWFPARRATQVDPTIALRAE